MPEDVTLGAAVEGEVRRQEGPGAVTGGWKVAAGAIKTVGGIGGADSSGCGGTDSHAQGGEAGLLLSRGGEGGRGFWTQNLVYQKWPDQIFPIVNFVFSHYDHFGLGRGGRGFWGEGSPRPLGFSLF